MSKQSYPRHRGTHNLHSTLTKACGAAGCTQRATKSVMIQFGYMRGDDEYVFACDLHSRIPGGNLGQWMDQFPTESWHD